MSFMVRTLHAVNTVSPNPGRAAVLDPAYLSATFTNSDLAPYIELIFYTDGTWLCYGSNPDFLAPQSGTWLTGTGTSADYYIYADLYGFGDGTLTGSPTQTWLSLATEQSWRVTQSNSYFPAELFYGSGPLDINYVPSFSPPSLASGYLDLSVGKVPLFGGG